MLIIIPAEFYASDIKEITYFHDVHVTHINNVNWTWAGQVQISKSICNGTYQTGQYQ